MPPELYADSAGDPRNAAFLGKACELAYLNDPAATPAFRDQLGLEGQLITVDNTQVFVGANANHIVAAFRGTESPTTIDGLKDWLLTNAVNFLVLPEGELGLDFAAAGVGARFHQGFLLALSEIWAPFFKAVDDLHKAGERPIWLTGHSLGGALAVLAAWRLERHFVPVHQVCTFGAPMVGNQDAAKAYEEKFTGRIFRYVDGKDLIPLLPTVSLVANTYRHFLKEMQVGEGGEATGLLQTLSSKAVEGVLNADLIEEIWGLLQERLNSHLMGNYLARIST